MGGKKLSKKKSHSRSMHISRKRPSRSTAHKSRAKVTHSTRPAARPVPRKKGSFRGTQAAVPASIDEMSRSRLDMLQSKLTGLHDDLLLTKVLNEVDKLGTTISMLPTRIEELRARGYVFRSFLERKVEVLDEQWDEIRNRVYDEVGVRSDDLAAEAEEAEEALYRAMNGNAAHIASAERAISALESKVNAATAAIEAMYSTLQQNIAQTNGQVMEIEWTLDQIDEASFQLYPDEDPILACRAQYMEEEKDGPKGVLYLTDARLIFEQKEEVATKKFLFIATEKEMVQKPIFAVPVGQIDEVKAEDKGRFIGRKEMLELVFSPEADFDGATLRLLNARNEDWLGLIKRVKSGEIDKERTQPKDEEVVEAVRTAPTKCPSCGATLSVEIVRGMREITCEYCGTVIRL